MATTITTGMDYFSAITRLESARSDEPLFVGQTRISRHSDETGDVIRVHLYGTVIAELTRHTVRIYSGGYHTPTTKRYINGVLASAGVDAGIIQRDYQWYYILDGRYDTPLDYIDGMEFTPRF